MDEERALYIGLIAIGVPTLVVELLRGATFGVIDTLALFTVIAACIGLLRAIRSQGQLPKAKIQR